MSEEKLEEIFIDAEDRMEKAVEATQRELNSLRAGRAHPSLLDRLEVSAYETKLPLRQVANVTATDARTLTITPYDKSIIKNIERAIMESDLGIMPQSDGQKIHLNIPPLTEERRRELVKLAHKIAEEGRVALRNIRRDANDHIKKLEKGGEISEDLMHDAMERVDKLLEKYREQIDERLKQKEAEIMEV